MRRASDKVGNFYHRPNPAAQQCGGARADGGHSGSTHDALGAVNLAAEKQRTAQARIAAEAARELAGMRSRSERRLFPGEQIGPLQRALLEPRLHEEARQRRQEQKRTAADSPAVAPPPRPAEAANAGLSFTSTRHSMEALERFLTNMR